MSGIYGSFLECFPELMESFEVWAKEDKSDMHKIRAVYIPTGGDSIKRRKYTSGNTGLDITDSDELYISQKYNNRVKIGDYVQKVGDNIIMRLVGDTKYDKSAGYRTYVVERVTGTTSEDTKDLPVREATFA